MTREEKSNKLKDDDGRYSLSGGRFSPGPLSAQGGPLYDQFQDFLYDSDVCSTTKGRVDALRTRLESVGVRFSDHPWIKGRRPNEWVFDAPFGGFLVIDKVAAEKILVLGLP